MPSARELMKEELKSSVKDSQETTNYSSSSFESYFTVPEQRTQWVPEGNPDGIKQYFDIIPFRIGNHFPDKTLPKTPKPGTFRHVMDIHVHRNVGPLNSTIICPLNTYKRGKCYSDEEAVELGKVKDADENVVGCPVCEDMKTKQAEEPDPDKRKTIWKEKRPSRRVMYNVMVRDGGEQEEKGVQIYEVSHFAMQQKLDALSEEDERTGQGSVTYPDPDEGKTIYFLYKKSGSGVNTTVLYEGHKFVDRVFRSKPYVISDEELEDVICLDDTLTLMTYNEIHALYHSVEDKKAKEEPEKKEEEEQETRGTRRLRRAEESAETKQEEKPAEEQAQEEPKPARRLRRETEEPVKEETSPADTGPSTDSCPFRHNFGKDTLEKAECNNCPDETYKACKAAQETAKETERPTGRRILRR